MRKLIVVGALVMAGCQNIVGPFQSRPPQRVDDPLAGRVGQDRIAEQQRRGRDRLALPEDRTGMAPYTYTDRPDPHGR